MKQEFNDVKIVKNAANLGFAAANNVGFRQSSGRYLLFLNPDTRLICPAINIMMEMPEVVVQRGSSRVYSTKHRPLYSDVLHSGLSDHFESGNRLE